MTDLGEVSVFVIECRGVGEHVWADTGHTAHHGVIMVGCIQSRHTAILVDWIKATIRKVCSHREGRLSYSP